MKKRARHTLMKASSMAIVGVSVIVAFLLFSVLFCYPVEISRKWYWISLVWFFFGGIVASSVQARHRLLWGLMPSAPAIGLVLFLLPVNLNGPFFAAFVAPLAAILLIESTVAFVIERASRSSWSW
jgi:hypothetical protein